MELWAKSNGTLLTKHTGDLLEAIEILQKKRTIPPTDTWWVALKYAALLHDIGKVDPGFQSKLGNKIFGEYKSDLRVPHGLLSLFLFNPIEDNVPHPETVRSAVAFHHWRGHFPQLFLGHRSQEISDKAEEVSHFLETWENLVLEAKRTIEHLAQKHNLDPSVISVNKNLIEYLKYNNLGNAGILIPPYTMVFLPGRLRISDEYQKNELLRIFITGNLMRADHFASLVEAGDSDLTTNDIEFGEYPSFEQVCSAVASRINPESFWQRTFFENQPELRKTNLILVAPTGFGKTEFAYLWGAGRRNIFTLPIKVAVNNAWQRTRDTINQTEFRFNNHVSLLHSDASLEIFNQNCAELDLDMELETGKAMDLAKHLCEPYIMSTADQIVPAALRYPGYERIFAVLMDSCLVIDEVQAYDPQAAAIVTHLIQQNHFLGGSTLLMTATLPPFIRQTIIDRVGIEEKQIINLLQKPEFQDRGKIARHKLRFLFHSSEDFAEPVREMLAAARNGKKVLAVFNTVKAAVNAFNILEKTGATDIDTILLHSRFTRARKKELEQLLVEKYMPNSPERGKREGKCCIVIATQLVEASLDIDADLLFTESSPADSLVQRMGRVFRRYARGGTDIPLDEANVVIMVHSLSLASDNGWVYDRDLTALSLVLLAAFASRKISLDYGLDYSGLLDKPEWSKAFRPAKRVAREKFQQVRQTANKNLAELIRQKVPEPYTLNEHQKVAWVESAYEILEKATGPNADRNQIKLNLGKYLENYFKTLEILDHGFCSDCKPDAQKLFRKICEIQVIPTVLLERFYKDMCELTAHSRISYLNLAKDIIPKYVLSIPQYRRSEKSVKPGVLDFDKMIAEGVIHEERNSLIKKFKNWFRDIQTANIDYSDITGVNYD
ncbi:MAG: CRISPR-associated endonuclease/helicase Cas3 [Pelotomaculum sp. PtaU1.Bin035]|nr:MAG: CRISPR-associated endonuclease/helicase Cas3 [Pelotomaculum sp. PtaU1.Bin035]